MSTDPDDDPTPPRDDAPLPLAPPGPNHDAHALLWLLDNARARHYRLGPVVEIGSIRVQVRDLLQEKMEGFGGAAVDDIPDDLRALTSHRGEEP